MYSEVDRYAGGSEVAHPIAIHAVGTQYIFLTVAVHGT